MSHPILLRSDFDAGSLRRAAKATKDAAQGRRLLAPAEIYEGAYDELAPAIIAMQKQSHPPRNPEGETGASAWVITNPPFRLGEAFKLEALRIARQGVAMLARTVSIESVGQYERRFRDTLSTMFASFVERVPMPRGRLDRNAWLVWKTAKRGETTQLVLIPHCRRSWSVTPIVDREHHHASPDRPRRRPGARASGLFRRAARIASPASRRPCLPRAGSAACSVGSDGFSRRD